MPDEELVLNAEQLALLDKYAEIRRLDREDAAESIAVPTLMQQPREQERNPGEGDK